VLHKGTIRGLIVGAGLWASATTALAAPQIAPAMPLGGSALPPAPYMDFCQRQPWDCGAAPEAVLAGVTKAKADRLALFAVASQPTAALPTTWAQGEADAAQAAPNPLMSPAALPVTSAILRNEDVQPTTPQMNPQLWSQLKRVNDSVNRAFRGASDYDTYGWTDYWTTPIEDGVRSGDCEDFVLEKQRALLAAGLPLEALNIAVVSTPRGETHAVLLVNTSEGEYVLDNLTPWIDPWQKTAYRWRQREVDGNPFKWAMVQDPARRPAAPPTAQEPAHPFIVAALH
jgi:predicted transglutaminase-like cysteine proteinase